MGWGSGSGNGKVLLVNILRMMRYMIECVVIDVDTDVDADTRISFNI